MGFFWSPNYKGYYNKDPKRDHNFDNQQHALFLLPVVLRLLLLWRLLLLPQLDDHKGQGLTPLLALFVAKTD